MKTRSKLFGAILAALSGVGLIAQPIGQWDFNGGDLTATVGGQPLTYLSAGSNAGVTFGTTTSFGIANVGGSAASVMKVTGFTAPDGIGMPVNSGPVVGSQVNQWTLIEDLLVPASSAGKVRALIETDGRIIQTNADLFIGGNDGIGVNGLFSGKVTADQWHRIAFVVDNVAQRINKYIDGVLVGVQDEGTGAQAGLDGRWALSANGTAELFNDNDGEVAPLYVNSIQLWNRTLNPGEIAALGGPSAAGIPGTIGSVPAFIDSLTPEFGQTGVSFQPEINVTLNVGDSTVTPESVKMLLDGTQVAAGVFPSGTNFILDFAVTDFLEPNASHKVGIVYSENGTLKTNSFSFVVANYQKITLPDPFLVETFDAVDEGNIPAGWVRTNHTSIISGHDLISLDDLKSDSYLDWTVVSQTRLQSLKSGIFNLDTVVLNGEQVFTLASGNMLYAESDVRGGSQVQMVFTSDYDFTGKSNVFVGFSSLYEQNQDNINSLEYSIDQGAHWLPALYLINQFNDVSNLPFSQADVFFNTDGTIDAVKTLNTVQGDTAYGTSYGAYIAAPITQALAPYISGRVNDDSKESKRIEVLRLFSADNQPKVRFRFMQAGTGSWYWGIDNLGFYSIPEARVVFSPESRTIAYGSTTSFKVTASGNPNLTYQWYHDDQLLTGKTNDTLTLSNVTLADQGGYYATVQNGLGSGQSKPANLTVIAAPTIVTQPQATVSTVGAPFSLTVTVQGQTPFTFQWVKDGTNVSGANASTYAVASAVATNAGNYRVIITNTSGSITSSPVAVTIIELPSVSLTQDLVLHLTFDGNYNDTSGRTNNATPMGNPTLEAGKFGQAMKFTTLPDGSVINYATLGAPDDLMFGDSTDFAVSFWVNWTSSDDDLPFISNKDWNSSGNVGWGVFSQSGGNYRVNVTGASGGTRMSMSSTPSAKDGTWHNIVVSFLRNQQVFSYLDGNLVNVTPLLTLGTIDTALNVNIGQDGTGAYTDGGSVNMTGMIDDVAVWRRALSAIEAKAIATATGDISSLTSNAPKITSFAFAGGNLTVNVTGASAGAHLQKRADFNAATQWIDAGPITTSATISVGTGSQFYRVVNP